MSRGIALRDIRCGRWQRTIAVWLLLLALTLPGFGSIFGFCCAPAQASDCCASSMKMPVMGAAQMAAMHGGAVTGESLMAAQCAPPVDPQISEFTLPGYSTIGRYLRFTRDEHPALPWNERIEASCTQASSLRIEKDPPGIYRSCPLSIVLKI